MTDTDTIRDASIIIESFRNETEALRAMVSKLLMALDGDEMTEALQAEARRVLAAGPIDYMELERDCDGYRVGE